MKKLPMILTAAMALSMVSSAALGANVPKSSADFSDLSQLNPASKAKFDAMISAGVFDGVGDHWFGLKDNMNRAQFAKVAALIFGLNVDFSLSSSSFSDVSASDPANGYALPYIEALKRAGLTDGVGPDSYDPAGQVTKEQLAAFLIRGLNQESEAAWVAGGLSDYTVSDWAKGYAALALQLKLMDRGADGTFGGTSAATRELLVTSSYAASQQPVVLGKGTNKLYPVTNLTQAQVKSVLQEKMTEGWRIGTVIKLYNISDSTIRIPDYELRAKAADGTVYTLQASASNPQSIAPQSFVELSYLAEIHANTDLNLTDLLWVDVDKTVYPKQETLLANAPISSIVWRGKDALANRLGNWGASFVVPGESDSLKYSAVNLSRQFSDQSPTYVVQLQVENTGSYTETVPDFTLGGKSEGKLFIGKRLEQAPMTLNPGEKKYVYVTVETEPDSQLTAFYVLSPASFLKQGQAAPFQYYTGRIGFKLPSSGTVQSPNPNGSSYEYGTAIAFDPNNDFVNPNMQVSLMELHVSNSQENGYKTAIAKFKLDNKSDQTIPVPALQTELANGNGTTYNGVRQTAVMQNVEPGTSTIVSYAYTLPTSETAASYTMKVQGSVQNAPNAPAYRSTIAALAVKVQPDEDWKQFGLYPYQLNIKSWTLIPVMESISSYSYKMRLDMDFNRDPQVMIDGSFSKLKIELVDGLGVSLGAEYFPFTGPNRLVSGSQTLLFKGIKTDQVYGNLSIKISESIQTPRGEMNRVIAVLP